MWTQIEFMMRQAGGLLTFMTLVLGALTAFYKKSQRFRVWCHDLKSLPGRMKSAEEQLTGNGGDKIRDKVKSTETNLLRALDQQNMMQEAMGLSQFRASSDGQFVEVSDALCRALGCPSGDLLGWCWIDKICEADREAVMVDWQKAVARRVRFRRHVCFDGADGEFNAEVIGQPRLGNGYYGLVIEREHPETA